MEDIFCAAVDLSLGVNLMPSLPFIPFNICKIIPACGYYCLLPLIVVAGVWTSGGTPCLVLLSPDLDLVERQLIQPGDG